MFTIDALHTKIDALLTKGEDRALTVTMVRRDPDAAPAELA